MSDFEHFVELRKKYFGNTATPEEAAEYIALYRSGKFADEDKQTHAKIWDITRPLSDNDRQIGEDIYAGLLENIHASKTRSLYNRVWLWAAAAILLFAVAGIWAYQRNTAAEAPMLAEQSLQTFAGPYYVKLPDYSTVELKAGSTLTYNAETFGISNRQIQLTGTAFFDVMHNPKLPFQVQSGRVITTVLGTSFNVSEADGIIDVTVVRGKVAVGDNVKTYSTIMPNEKITVATTNMTFVKRAVNPRVEVEWKDKNLIIDELTWGDAIALLEKRFAVKIRVENTSLKSCTVSAYFVNDESLSQILDVLCKLKQATYFISGTNVVIHGGDGCSNN